MLEQRGFQLLDEQPLATHLGQGHIEQLVATRGHAQQFYRQAWMGALQRIANEFGLPQGQGALPGGNGD